MLLVVRDSIHHETDTGSRTLRQLYCGFVGTTLGCSIRHCVLATQLIHDRAGDRSSAFQLNVERVSSRSSERTRFILCRNGERSGNARGDGGNRRADRLCSIGCF